MRGYSECFGTMCSSQIYCGWWKDDWAGSYHACLYTTKFAPGVAEALVFAFLFLALACWIASLPTAEDKAKEETEALFRQSEAMNARAETLEAQRKEAEEAVAFERARAEAAYLRAKMEE